jgi:hypothetical protein
MNTSNTMLIPSNTLGKTLGRILDPGGLVCHRKLTRMLMELL